MNIYPILWIGKILILNTNNQMSFFEFFHQNKIVILALFETICLKLFVVFKKLSNLVFRLFNGLDIDFKMVSVHTVILEYFNIKE